MAKRRVLLTRKDNSALAELLKSGGVEVVELPLIDCSYAVNADDASDVFDELGGYDWITFSSPNSVRGFFKAFFNEFADIRSLGIARIACVGDSTARELQKFFIKADVVPERQTAAEMANAMGEFQSLENLKILSVRGNLALPELVKALEKHNAIVDTFEVYRTSHKKLAHTDAAVGDFKKSGADVVVFASPSAVESFVKNAETLALEDGAVRPKVVAIGPTTAAAVRKFSMKVAAEAEAPTAEAVFNAISSLL